MAKKGGAAAQQPAKTYSQEEIQRVKRVRDCGVELQQIALDLATAGEPDLSAKVLAAAYKASKVKGRPEVQP